MNNSSHKSIAIIPARSGSKGLPRKNVLELKGKPLLGYSIEAAIESGVFDEVMVSTDSKLYSEIARKFGASVPFLRDESLSLDTTSVWDVVRDIIKKYDDFGKRFDMFCLLQPTSPLRKPEDIRNAYNILREKASVAVISVCEPEHSPLLCGRLYNDESLDGFFSRELPFQRQKLDKYYRVNGAIYFAYVQEFLKDDFLYRKGSFAYIMDQERSIDIDTKFDFVMAEALLQSIDTATEESNVHF